MLPDQHVGVICDRNSECSIEYQPFCEFLNPSNLQQFGKRRTTQLNHFVAKISFFQ